ncbi:MAG: hypothetical protein ACTH32_06735 [Microbacterium gubbeenense]|uniref:hypothetical protein n=1 Tax=Microbacterium gubbeenense TaxID=159896 RepID=UPI003F9AE0B1
MTISPAAFDFAFQEISERSKKSLYQRDFAAWLSDVLGERMYDKMAGISEDVLFGKHPRTLVKSANGSGKTHSAARWALWWCTAFPADESLAILTAPTLRQVSLGTLAYIKSAHGDQKMRAAKEGKPNPWPGWISEQGEWKYSAPGGNQTLAVARVPGASDAVSTFQGLRKTGGRNFIMLDEAGGVSRDIFLAIDALMTSGDSRMGGIGNPDRRGTAFYDAFTDPRVMREYNLHTISAYDLPTLTGEVVYPDDPEKERMLHKGLTSAKWVFERERLWKMGGEIEYDEQFDFERNRTGRPDGRFKAKVQGQFPDEDDHTFFPEEPILRARERTIEPTEDDKLVLGVDLATTGTDESVIVVNHGGQVRVFDKKISYMDGDEMRETTGTWAKEDELSAARRVHAVAKWTGASEVRVDAAGIGAGIATNLERLDEFHPRDYLVIRVSGGRSSSDADRWANTRAQNHDYLRELLAIDALDLDETDDILKDQLLNVTYDLNKRGAVQVTPKVKMRTEMHGSPDRLDAVIYAIVDSTPLVDPPLGDLQSGDLVSLDPWDLIQDDPYSALYPM